MERGRSNAHGVCRLGPRPQFQFLVKAQSVAHGVHLCMRSWLAALLGRHPGAEAVAIPCPATTCAAGPGREHARCCCGGATAPQAKPEKQMAPQRLWGGLRARQACARWRTSTKQTTSSTRLGLPRRVARARADCCWAPARLGADRASADRRCRAASGTLPALPNRAGATRERPVRNGTTTSVVPFAFLRVSDVWRVM